MEKQYWCEHCPADGSFCPVCEKMVDGVRKPQYEPKEPVDNRKIVHDVRGKLTPVKHLIWAVMTQYDDEMSDNTGAKGHKFIQDNMENWAKDADEYLDKVLELLDKIE